VSWSDSASGTIRSRPAPLLVAAVSAAVVWLGVGLYGLARYVVNYERYRGFAPPARIATNMPAGRVVDVRFFSPALGRRASYILYLPPGYAAAARLGARYPVLYLLHPPPGSPKGYLTIGALQQRMDTLIATHRIRPYLVAIPDGHTSKDGNDTEWANAGAGRYEDFLLDVVRSVDHRWATITSRADRAIAGLSEGGYGAANVALHHLDVFGTFESWSGYFFQTPTLPFKGASAALLAANSPNDYVGALAPQLAGLPTYAFIYRGSGEHLTSHLDTVTFVRRFQAAGGHVRMAEWPGMHNWRLWRVHMPLMLRFASAHFA
jgi:enterochelin esterase-like enzyme